MLTSCNFQSSLEVLALGLLLRWIDGSLVLTAGPMRLSNELFPSASRRFDKGVGDQSDELELSAEVRLKWVCGERWDFGSPIDFLNLLTFCCKSEATLYRRLYQFGSFGRHSCRCSHEFPAGRLNTNPSTHLRFRHVRLREYEKRKFQFLEEVFSSSPRIPSIILLCVLMISSQSLLCLSALSNWRSLLRSSAWRAIRSAWRETYYT